MKQLSTEEKARRYDEAIKKAESLYKAAEPMSGCNVLLETVFPELAESEDRKIKKIISDILLIDSDEIREILDANNVLMQDIDDWLSHVKQLNN